ncbi:MFS transporter [Beggiatoa leptomitoformis]|uniref:MFS transporter n=1 Tax=Beggiatoa leptomitoformis TaxID=288004 RepID=A0A2N9YD87_9GAMM|nr:MFS transporter [Beggiatoa leptomitoformis]ALG69143.1 MFS transporter [Beggiatoa leptomitoformis]AUI68437.1 MFS transporter [Beggiatoa leptomitoformis]
MSQSHLIHTRRFLPYFCTQFLGAFNDNVYKNSLVILIIFQGSSLFGMDSNQLVTFSAGFFILPFFLFSATAGQIADKYDKSILMRWTKVLEIFVMGLAIFGFFLNNILILIMLLFLMGAQSALFGPVKYGVVPQLLHEDELVGGNGLISMGTFLAILLGTILGGVLIASENGTMWVSAIVVVIAVLGWIASLYVPPVPPADPNITVNWNVFSQTLHSMGFALENRSVFLSVLAISWFWFVGATYLAQFPAYTKYILGGNEGVVTLLLTMFSVGIGIGSLSCEKLSRGKLETGLVPLGALGITLFSIDVYFASNYFYALQHPAGTMTVSAFLSEGFASWRVLADLVLIGLFGGFYIVPLNVIVQTRSDPAHRSRIIAANNIINALFMVLSSVYAMLLLKYEVSIGTIFLSLGALNFIYSLGIFLFMPEFLTRFVGMFTARNTTL